MKAEYLTTLLFSRIVSPLSISHPFILFPLSDHSEGRMGRLRKYYMQIPSLADLLQAGVHFGHKTSRWHPKMKEFIYTGRSGVHVLDLQKTQERLSVALETVQSMAAQGKKILFITTKPQAREIVKAAALAAGMPYLVDRWIGGLLTNFPEFRRLIKKYLSLKEQKESGELERYTKKEQLRIAKEMEKMERTLIGLTALDAMPDALFIPSVQKEKTAVTEAGKMHIPIFGICDSNANPSKAAYPIPANDDAVRAITLLVDLVGQAARAGHEEFEKNQAAAKVQKETMVVK